MEAVNVHSMPYRPRSTPTGTQYTATDTLVNHPSSSFILGAVTRRLQVKSIQVLANLSRGTSNTPEKFGDPCDTLAFIRVQVVLVADMGAQVPAAVGRLMAVGGSLGLVPSSVDHCRGQSLLKRQTVWPVTSQSRQTARRPQLGSQIPTRPHQTAGRQTCRSCRGWSASRWVGSAAPPPPGALSGVSPPRRWLSTASFDDSRSIIPAARTAGGISTIGLYTAVSYRHTATMTRCHFVVSYQTVILSCRHVITT